MVVSPQIAAKKLFDGIAVPAGFVNTMVERVGNDQYLKVLVDPSYCRHMANLPNTFMGYKVVVETRKLFVAYGR